MNQMNEQHRRIFNDVNERALQLKERSLAYFTAFESSHNAIIRLRLSGLIHDRHAARLRMRLLRQFESISIPAPVNQRDYELRIVQSDVSSRQLELEGEVAKWKSYFIPFAIVHAGQYGEAHYGKNCLHFTHYDLLKEAGARLVDFTRCGDPLEQP